MTSTYIIRTTSYAIVALMLAALLHTGVVAADEYEEATAGMDRAAMMEMIEQLTAQIAELQAMVNAQRETAQAFREEVRAGLRMGMQDEDVRRLQELLATDPEIYPEAFTTGYFGNLTSQALSRLQTRHSLPSTGELDEATRDLINGYFAERTGRDSAPEGLLRAPGIIQAVERGICDRGRGNRPFCPPVADAEAEEETEGEGRPEEEDEEDEGEEAERVIDAETARAALDGAARGINYVSEAIQVAPRAANVSESRRALVRAQDYHRAARRAYNAEAYDIAYNEAVTARQYAARAMALLPDRAREREQVRTIVDRFEALERELDRVDEDEMLEACGLREFQNLIGEEVDRAAIMELWEEIHGTEPGTRSVRILAEGDAMTMDYIETRVNIFTDEAGEVIERVTCG